MSRGYFGIGIEHGKTIHNIGTLWRSADLLGASFIFTIGRRYKTQSSDTLKSVRHIPLWHFNSIVELLSHSPHSCPIVGVEMVAEARMLADYTHPQRAIYLLGAEDNGLSKEAISRCHDFVRLPGRFSMNVAVAGSIVLYDRATKGAARIVGRSPVMR